MKQTNGWRRVLVGILLVINVLPFSACSNGTNSKLATFDSSSESPSPSPSPSPTIEYYNDIDDADSDIDEADMQKILKNQHLIDLSQLPVSIKTNTLYYGTDSLPILNAADIITYTVISPSLPIDQYIVVALEKTIIVYLKIPGAAQQLVLARQGSENQWASATEYAQTISGMLDECINGFKAPVIGQVVLLNDTLDSPSVVYLLVDDNVYFDASCEGVMPELSATSAVLSSESVDASTLGAISPDLFETTIAEQSAAKQVNGVSICDLDSLPNLTTGRRNALRQAYSYLSFMSFSHDGLIKQLKHDGYTTDEATYAADYCGADWYEQASIKAAAYLEFMAFSRERLIHQLEFEGFTNDQAVYGVGQNGY